MISPAKFYLACLFFLSACTTLSPTNIEDNITSKVISRWNALINHQWSDAYQYETNGYRESHTVEQFKAKFGQSVSWKKINVLKVHFNESKSKATVSVSLPYEMKLQGFGVQKSNAYLTEIWLLDEGMWRHYTK